MTAIKVPVMHPTSRSFAMTGCVAVAVAVGVLFLPLLLINVITLFLLIE